MKRLVVLTLVFAAIVAMALANDQQVAAGGPGTVVFNSNKFFWHVQWSQPSQGSYETRWSLRTIFTETVTMASGGPSTFMTNTTTTEVGPDGWFIAVGGSLTDTVVFPWAFSLSIPNADTSVMETLWRRENCASGPEYFVEINEYPNSNDSRARVVVHNTTGRQVYLYAIPGVETKDLAGGGITVTKTLKPDEWAIVEQRVSSSSRTGFVELMTRPDFDWGVSCSTFSWHFPEMINLDLTPVPSTPIPTSVTVTLNSGWNNIAVPASGPRFAQDVLTELSELGLGPVQIARWQNGAWETHLHNFSANNFSIEPGRGYFVRIERGGAWVPGRAIVMSIQGR